MTTSSTIKKLLIANRGEIAVRIIRSAKEMGIKTVAVFSEADRSFPHVLLADEAVCIGPAASKDSYLRGDKIIEVAKQLQVDAIHPGYGFLSENAAFSQAVAEAGILFVGPSAESIRLMGDKISAKQTVKKSNVPLVPGVDEAITDKKAAKHVAVEVGFPVLVKASAGGGGKGMRIVEAESEFDEQLDRAVSEAIQAFGDGSVFIEKYITKPRHIEVQIMADKHGNVVHLFERECSIQRRHQKLVEEAPSAVLTPELREAMGQCAVEVAKACGYYGAGTVEFILDDQLNFYFLEMNTRLQVEHPVTELITGIDLVREMIRVAEGHPLSIRQEDLKIHGHAIELRICVEDPYNNFLPDIGRLDTYIRPQGNGVRVDDGIEQGMDIPIHYDPMIAKLIVHAATRQEAMQKMVRVIDEFKITGVKTTLPFGKFVMQNEAFQSGDFDTRFIDIHFKDVKEPIDQGKTVENQIAAALAVELFKKNKKSKKTHVASSQLVSMWKVNRLNK
jgi:propionyl-CoA carboxylase alpha chain